MTTKHRKGKTTSTNKRVEKAETTECQYCEENLAVAGFNVCDDCASAAASGSKLQDRARRALSIGLTIEEFFGLIDDFLDRALQRAMKKLHSAARSGKGVSA